MGRFVRGAGFTLFELMVALVVVGVLAAIALPAYFKQVQRSNRSAGEQYMQDLANREEQYRLDSRSYTTSKAACWGGAFSGSEQCNAELHGCDCDVAGTTAATRRS